MYISNTITINKDDLFSTASRPLRVPLSNQRPWPTQNKTWRSRSKRPRPQRWRRVSPPWPRPPPCWVTRLPRTRRKPGQRRSVRGQRHAETKNFRKIRIGFWLEERFCNAFFMFDDLVIEYCGFIIWKTVPYTREKKKWNHWCCVKGLSLLGNRRRFPMVFQKYPLHFVIGSTCIIYW